jgi:acyl-coenzyme A synthetase/AMP-(fatty) acid ligase
MDSMKEIYVIPAIPKTKTAKTIKTRMRNKIIPYTTSAAAI